MSKFTMVLNEKEMSMIAEALEFCPPSEFHSAYDFAALAEVFDLRLQY